MSDIKHHAVEAVTNLSAKITAGTGVGVAGVSAAKKGIEGTHVAADGWGLSEWGIVFGMAIAFLSWITQLGINWHFNRKRLEIERHRTQQIIDLTQASNYSASPEQGDK